MNIKEGLNDKEIEKIIEITKVDSLIQKFTHDSNRFKNKNEIREWKKDKKIYLLYDNENICGIVWFSKRDNKLAKGYPFTFAIRVYEHARGKGVSEYFMEKVFRLFDPKKEKKYWLSTKVENKVAIHIYNKFGFKNKWQSKEEIIMVFDPISL